MYLKKPVFWNNKNLLSVFLYPLTLITFLINLSKNLNKKKKFSIKTICVGNIYLGGTGKTSLVIKINKLLSKKYKTVFIKKKYTNQVDEQKLLELNGNLICSKTRDKAIKNAENKNYEVGILDDGLQDKSIKYDVSIVCFNTTSGFGNSFLLPAGPLRENISALNNYDAIFLNGEKKNTQLKSIIKKSNKDIKVFEGKYIPTNLKSFNRNKKYIIFSGLGNPQEFKETLKKYNFKIEKNITFPDHYKFTSSDICKIKEIAKIKKLKILTTEKDYLRLNKNDKKNIKYLKIELQIKNSKNFLNFLKKKL